MKWPTRRRQAIKSHLVAINFIATIEVSTCSFKNILE